METTICSDVYITHIFIVQILPLLRGCIWNVVILLYKLLLIYVLYFSIVNVYKHMYIFLLLSSTPNFSFISFYHYCHFRSYRLKEIYLNFDIHSQDLFIININIDVKLIIVIILLTLLFISTCIQPAERTWTPTSTHRRQSRGQPR